MQGQDAQAFRVLKPGYKVRIDDKALFKKGTVSRWSNEVMKYMCCSQQVGSQLYEQMEKIKQTRQILKGTA